MKTSRTATAMLVFLALSLLAACGNKGDLVRPGESADASTDS